MKVEIEIKKKDLRSILCAAIRNYYCEVKMRLEPHKDYLWQLDRGDRYIIENLLDIRDACDAISNLCNLIEELETVEPNDASGVILFDDSEDNRNDKEQ